MPRRRQTAGGADQAAGVARAARGGRARIGGDAEGEVCPTIDPVRILIFAGDHGVADAGVSAYPKSVTAQMVTNMATGGAAISVLAEALATDLELIVLGTVGEIACDPVPPSVRLVGVAPFTKDFSREPAMSSAELDACLAAGRAAVEHAVDDRGCRLVIGGEMGIGNSTAAAAVACALLERPAPELAGSRHRSRRRRYRPQGGLDRARPGTCSESRRIPPSRPCVEGAVSRSRP